MSDNCEFSVIVLGEAGNGKSQLCNSISSTDKYPVSSGINSMTNDTTFNVVNFAGIDRKVRLFDTPGMNDSGGRDSEHIEKMVRQIKNITDAKAFILVINSEQPRFTGRMKEMCELFRDVFGIGYLANLCLVFTKWYCDDFSEKRRKKQGITQQKIREDFSQELKTILNINFDVNSYFVDTDPECKNDNTTQELKRLFQWAVQNDPYDCRNIEKKENFTRSNSRRIKTKRN